MDYVLSIDCGTQSIRAMVFDPTGQVLLQSKKKFTPYFSKEPGWAEQDANLYFEKVCEATKELRQQDENIFNQIDTIVVTAQRDTAILVDKNGEPLRPAILWADDRKARDKRKLSFINNAAISIIGMKKIGETLSENTHAHWVQDYEPQIWEKTYKYLQVSGYINYKLTGVFKDSIASQIGHIPFEYKKFRWAKKGSMKSELAQIGRDKLVDIVPSTKILGYVTKEAALATGLKEGAKVIAGGSDKGCETLGVGCMDNDVVSISLGSQASIQTTSEKYYEVERFIPPFPAVIPGRYNPEIQVYRGYWMITWFKQEFASREMEEAKRRGISPEELLNEELLKVPPGAEGLMLQPYWGAAVKKPEAKGAIIGFSDYHTRIHIYRAIIEGIGFALYDGMCSIEKKSGVTVRKVAISGGGSQSDAICQITADIFKRPVYRVQTIEASSLGAAIIGYVANGTYAGFSEAVKNMSHTETVFEPNPQNALIYERLYKNIYKKTYKKLRPLYMEMRAIMKE